MNTKLSGDLGEQIAVDTLKEKGYNILERNAKYSDCEVDIICEAYVDENGNLIKPNAFDKVINVVRKALKKQLKKRGEKLIVFVEVKTRYGEEFGAPEEAVTPYKVGRYITASKSYLSMHRLVNANVRFDIFAVSENGYRHIEDAFCENDAKYPRNYR